MATTNFVSGTLIESTWLNDVDAHVYDQGTGAHTAANIAVVDTAGNFTATDVEGVLAEISAGAGGLQYFTEGRSIAAPNATVPVHSFTAIGSETDIDAVLAPKGTGAILADVPDNTSGGGNKRGARAVDLQMVRGNTSQVASGTNSVVSGGSSNTASGTNSTASGGSGCTASGEYSSVGGGNINTADGDYSTVPGGQRGWTRGLYGRFSYGSGLIAIAGDAQMGMHVLRRTTTDATPAIVTANGSTGATSTNVSVLPDNHAYVVSARVVARNTATNDTATWKVEGAVKRGANAAATALVGAPTVTSLGADAGMATAAVALIADTTLGAAEIQVTGIAATTINWVCKFDTVEVG